MRTRSIADTESSALELSLSVAVVPADSTCVDRAKLLASELAIPFFDGSTREHGVTMVLQVAADGLLLSAPGSSIGGNLAVDFVRGPTAFRRMAMGNRRQPLARAVGIRHPAPFVLDATAGLARDMFQLACLGCRVVGVERSSVLFALVRDGLDRALASHDVALHDVVGRIDLRRGDARDLLRSMTPEVAPDVVYLDPMYVPSERSALPKKEMRLCRMLVGDDKDAGDLFDAARRAARERVVVKRYRKAEPLAPGISFQSIGRVVRYDVYLTGRPRKPKPTG